MKIEIKKTKGMWSVSCGDKYTSELDFGEMLTIVIQLTTVPQLGEVRDFYPKSHKRSTNPASCQTAVSGSAFSIHDLKCGNILNYDTAEGEILPTVIDWQDLKWLTEDPKGFNLVYSPIRLDEDNVKKLGFEFFHKHNLGYKGESEDLFLSNWLGYIEVFYGGNPLEIYFVHELQNFYYCLTGVMLSLS